MHHHLKCLDSLQRQGKKQKRYKKKYKNLLTEKQNIEK